MQIRIQGAREHNLQAVDVTMDDGLTVVTGVSGSGKTSLVFDTLYHESRRRYLEIYSTGAAAQRLSPANVEEIAGLGPAVAVGQNLLNRNPASTLATSSGLHPFLRLLYANFGERSCPHCGAALSVFTQDEIINLLANKVKGRSIELFAVLLRNVAGSHSTLMHLLSDQLGPDRLLVDGMPWNNISLDSASPHSLEVHVAKLDATSSVTRIRQVMEDVHTLGSQALTIRDGESTQTLSHAPVCLECGTWFGDLRPVDFRSSCPHCQGVGCRECGGTGILPQAAAVRWQGFRFNELLSLSVDAASQIMVALDPAISASRLVKEIKPRLDALQQVGLGYISLDRPSPTLSRGEAQRVRLAVMLVSRLEDMLHILDEPTIGQHPADVKHLLPAFRDLPGPVVFVEHDRTSAAGADHAIDLGPGAGSQGGRVVFSGTPSELWQANTATGRYFSLRSSLPAAQAKPQPREFLTFRKITLRNLQNIDVSIPLRRLTVVTGVSGSGKSTLVEDVICASLESSAPVGCLEVDGIKLKVVMVDQSPIGRNPRSNPATYTKLADIIRDLFASTTGLSPSHFSFNRPEGRCPTCEGLGAVEVAMRFLPSTWLPCPDCDGLRFSEAVLEAHIQLNGRTMSIADFFALSVSEVQPLFTKDERLSPGDRQSAERILEAFQDIGLGYLTLGQPSPTLSGGEAQRVKLARYLGMKSLEHQLLILDEPSTGLHPQDLAGLLAVLDRLVRHGATILVVEHNTDMIRSADWVIDLGPGSGPKGGLLLYAGPPAGLVQSERSITGDAMREERSIGPVLPSELDGLHSDSLIPKSQNSISIRGARAHNLQNVDIDFPKGKLTVVTGVSGSGKSSLVSDILELEARRRFLETLSLYERQGIHEGAEAEVDSIGGLGVAVTVGPERLVYSRRATVGVATEIHHHLAVLLSIAGQRTCLVCGNLMQRSLETWTCPGCGATAPVAKPRHFSSTTYAAACLKCNGVGSVIKPVPEKLIIHPERPLLSGAMYSPGFFPQGYLGKPFNGGHYAVLALAERYQFDPFKTPWNELSLEAQKAFLFGDPVPMTITSQSRTGRARSYQSGFPGFYGFIRDWDVGGTYTDTIPCPECTGARLRPEFLAVRLDGHNIHSLSVMPLSQLASVLDGLKLAPESLRLVQSNLKTIQRRLRFLIQTNLAYLHLDRPAGTLSAGEVQRIRLAGLLGSGLTSLTILLDEPTRGLHPSEVSALIEALTALKIEGNTVIVVEHDVQVMEAADHLVDMGPGAGKAGGRIVAQGPPKQLAGMHTLTGDWLCGERRISIPPRRVKPQAWLIIRGARANNLQNIDVAFPLNRLVGVCGVSGSGKSSLVIDTLGRALAPRKQTTSVAREPVDPGEHDSIDGALPRTVLVDQSKAGLVSPASFLDLIGPLRTLFTASEDAQALGIPEDKLYAHCTVCGGSGTITLDMAFLPDVHIPCETCQGTGYTPEAWEVRLKGLSLPEVLSLTIDEVYEKFAWDDRLGRPLGIAREVGLGYLVLRQPGYALSGGEAQRLKIAGELYHRLPANTLYILDEPTIGQHLEDVQRLLGVLHRLVDAGGTVFAVEHNAHFLAACDWLIELGPGGGPEGGRLIASGTPYDFANGNTPTAPYLRAILEGSPR